MHAPFARLPLSWPAALLCVCLPISVAAQGAAPPKSPPPSSGKSGKSGPVLVRPTIPPELRKASEAFFRAVALHKAARPVEAVAAYKEFLRLAAEAHIKPEQTLPAYENLAALYRYQGDSKNMEAALLHIVALDPHNANAYVQLATLYSAQRRFDEAGRDAAKALSLSPPANLAAPAHFVLGTVAAMRNADTTAEKEFATALRLVPGNPQAQFDYAVILGRLKKYRPALAAAEKAKSLAPNVVQTRLYIGELKVQLSDFPGALAAYQDVLKQEPRNPTALFNAAVMLHRLGRTQEAISAYLDTLAVMPDNAGAHLDVAQLYLSIQNFTAARHHYAAVLKTKPKDVRALSGLAMSESGDAFTLTDPNQRKAGLDQAEAHFKQALALAPNDREVQDALGRTYEHAGRYEDALKLYHKQQATAPDDVDTYRKLARVYTMQRNAKAVLATWREYRQHRPDDPTSYAGTARILEAQGKQEEAIGEWKLLLARHPKDGNAIVAIGQDLAVLKKYPEAKAQFNAVLALDATGGDAPDAKTRPILSAAVKAQQLDALRGLAAVADAEGKTDEAVSYWNQVKSREAAVAAQTNQPPNPETYRAIATAYEKAKKPDLAIKEFQALAQALPTDPTPYEDLARVYESQDRVEDAAAAFRQAMNRAEDPLSEGLKLAELYRRHQKLDQAISEFEQLQGKYPQESRLFAPMAQTYEQAGKDEKALATYDALLKVDANAHWAEDKKATVLSRLKRYPEAQAIYVKELDRNPDSYQTYADLARIYQLEGRADAYLAWLQARLDKTPARTNLMAAVVDAYTQQKREDAGWAYVRGMVDRHKTERPVLEAYAGLLSRRERRPEALEVYRQIAALSPNDLDAQTNVADQLDLNGKKEEGNQIYLDLIARPAVKADERLGLRRILASRYVQQGKMVEAIAQLQEIRKTNPNDFLATEAQAQALSSLGRDQEAVPLFASLLKQTDYPPAVRAQIHDAIGGIYEKQGRKTDALGEYREALKLNPDDPKAAQGLKRLGGL